MSWPTSLVVGEYEAVLLPADVALWLDRVVGSRRWLVRGQDTRRDGALAAVHLVALAEEARRHFRTLAPAAEVEPAWVNTEQAATALGVSTRRVRQLITAGQLPARRTSTGYQLQHTDIHEYRNRRNHEPDAPDRSVRPARSA